MIFVLEKYYRAIVNFLGLHFSKLLFVTFVCIAPIWVLQVLYKHTLCYIVLFSVVRVRLNIYASLFFLFFLSSRKKPRISSFKVFFDVICFFVFRKLWIENDRTWNDELQWVLWKVSSCVCHTLINYDQLVWVKNTGLRVHYHRVEQLFDFFLSIWRCRLWVSSPFIHIFVNRELLTS